MDIIEKEMWNLVNKYKLQLVAPNGNESKAFEGKITEGIKMRMGLFARCDPWINAEISFGEVRSLWENHTPMGEHGFASASSENKETHDPDKLAGSAIPGNEIVGLKWRVGAVAPKSRTHVSEVGDYFIQVNDIIEHLLSLAPIVMKTEASENDFTHDLWETATEGW